jgi:hypothetical protein
MEKINIVRLINAALMLSLGILMIILGSRLEQSWGIMSPVCQNLTWQGYFEDNTEWVAHDSCIIGPYVWQEKCYFVIPWWQYSRCLAKPLDNKGFWETGRYLGYEYNKTCDEELWKTNYTQMSTYNTRCVTSPFVKAIPLLPAFLGIGFIGIAIAILCGVIKEWNIPEEKWTREENVAGGGEK